MKMEYRLNDEKQNYPAIYHYSSLDVMEITCRLSCEYFVKNKRVYKAVSTALEPNELHIIYVEEHKMVSYEDESTYGNIGFEIREIHSNNKAPVIKREQVFSHADVVSYLHSDFIYIPNDIKTETYKEMQLDSLEIDEDRNCYVFYGIFTGVDIYY
ncbi:hypothetical protein EJF36_09915 [Bacillus sp. HMF5848]|uniref:hypothetical protein n=1 Tax=Bacillus sp. HMF5848 TaxID=2495421 RepID=UPI000F7A8BE1|nr:hypothetical protein [Bacillus sp. HMF5848]RSK27168.1 hypothetical protein EJF36_09915 [Bacillus sp. HMF5848]